jgi:hypothetical protein
VYKNEIDFLINSLGVDYYKSLKKKEIILISTRLWVNIKQKDRKATNLQLDDFSLLLLQQVLIVN